MSKIKEFVMENFRMIVMIVSFIVTMYVQHVNNTMQLAELKERCVKLEIRIQDQYDRIDAIKLDKAVFEANMAQFTSIQADLREMRADIKELLHNH
ncbi:hypothetical protein [Bacteroides sp. 51]|uniref:hypothetical protein n=1 Tax=Bacteroides sp. 51 TaxID=2302938 RepID=UPI0013D4704C|nr:hypothetical protein [Bacteroides sp. 51]NDV80865.1 hypothetical protein [Bacteroides sp. 51]